MSATPTQLRLHQEHVARVNRMWTAGVTQRPTPPPMVRIIQLKPPPWHGYYCAIKIAPRWFDWWTVPSENGRIPSVKSIAIVVAHHFGISFQTLCSGQRQRPLPWMRQLVYYLAKTMTTCSLPIIGNAIGGRDHTTVLHGINNINNALANPQTSAATMAILRELRMEVLEYCESHP